MQHFECDDATEIWHILQILVLPLSYLIPLSLLSCSPVSMFRPAFSRLQYEKVFACGESLGTRLVVMFISLVFRPSPTSSLAVCKQAIKSWSWGSLVPRPLPDFISQPWRKKWLRDKIWEWPGDEA